MMKTFLTSVVCLALLSASVMGALPNILWIVAEDMSPDLGCYGNQLVTTPNLDRLASQGMRFERAFVTGPACSPSRTALATGVYQTTLGACHMRYQVPLQPGVRTLPALLRQRGYKTGNVRKFCGTGTGKDDWLFTNDAAAWDTSRWEELVAHQPFFAQINFSESHRGFKASSAHPVHPADVTLPPYYPDHAVAREDWAGYLMEVNTADEHVGRILARLEADGLADSTIVVFLSDHGRPMIRGKNWLYDSGTQVPLIVYIPPGLESPPGYSVGTVDSQLISGVDITAQTLALAGASQPGWMQGRPFLAGGGQRDSLVTAVDVIGNIETCSRAVRTERFKYIRNIKRPASINECSTPYRRAAHPIYHLLNLLGEQGRLDEAQAQLLRPLAEEELYDLAADPDEVVNLAGDPAYGPTLSKLRATLDRWITESGDLGIRGPDPATRRLVQEYGQWTLAARRGAIEARRREVARRLSAPQQ